MTTLINSRFHALTPVAVPVVPERSYLFPRGWVSGREEVMVCENQLGEPEEWSVMQHEYLPPAELLTAEF